MTIDHAGPEYVYLQLAALLRDRITSGDLPPGALVPSITTLAADHDIAVITVRKALAVLIAEGRIVTKPGRGTYVTG